MKLSESLEDYLETILALEEANKVARVKDIAEKSGVLRGSVTSALKNLSEKGLINYEPYSFITLTPEGKKIASEVTRRHEVIRGFLANVLQMGNEASEANACRMEHAMDAEAVDRLIQFIDFVNQCPRTGPDWVKRFRKFRLNELPDPEECKACIQKCKIR